MYKILFLLGMLLCSPIWSKATHLVGGEITYECQGYNEADDTYTYNIVLTVYNDCGPANVNNTFFDIQASIGVFEDDEDLFENLLLNYPGSYESIDTELNNPCVTSPISACVRKAVYEGTVDLDFAEGGYTVVYQRCCRNWSISNVSNAGSTGMTLQAYIPEPEDDICNNSPVFNDLPPSFLCNNYEFELDFSANDADGDSLVYELCTPYWGGSVDFPQPSPPEPPPYSTITWSAGYSSNITFSTVNGISFDSQTGILSGMPDEVGIFAIAICVSEYRDGELLSQISRDYQIGIYNCPSVIESFFSEQNLLDACDGLTVEFENNSSNSDSYFWDFGVENMESDTSIELDPVFEFPEPGTYLVTLIAEPGGVCADTSFQLYTVNDPLDVFFDTPEIDCYPAANFSFAAQGNYSDTALFSWEFGNSSLTSTLENPQNIVFPGPGTYEVSLTVESGVCITSVFSDLTIPDNVEAEIVEQTEFCTGLEISFNNASTNADEYLWIFGEFGDQYFSTETSPTILFEEEGPVSVTLIAYNDLACPDTATQNFEVYPYMMPYFELDQDVYCFDGHSIDLSAGGTYQEDIAVIEWDLGANSAQFFSNQITTSTNYSEPGYYPITLTIFENNCEKNYTQIAEIHPNPKAEFMVLDSNGCKPLIVQFINLSEAWTDMTYEWDFGNGAFSTQESPMTTYPYSGFYFPTLSISTAEGCIGEDSYTLEWPIHAFPIPQANFSIEPNVVDILTPLINVTDLSLSSIDVFYEFSNGDSMDSPNFNYTFSDAGQWQITQTVWNEYGCTDKVTGGVIVKGFLFFMPNAFTPNGDGYNDVLLPEYTGILTYSLQIYNRWGQIAFTSDNPDYGWDGFNAQDGVYNYIVKLTDLTKTPYHFTGSITLTR